MTNYNESAELGETVKGGKPPTPSTYLTLAKAIEFGEYDPDYLTTFPDWNHLSRHSQFELIKQAIDNRSRQLQLQWAEINNVLNFSKKPYLTKALTNIQKQIKKLEVDREELFIEYSTV